MGQRMLIIDDDADTCKLVSKVVLKAGFIADTSCSAEEGLKMFNETHYDILLCDYNIDERDGLYVLKKIKEVAPETIVIIMTGYLNRKIETVLKENGAFAYMSKPIFSDDILLILKDSIPVVDTI